MRDHERGLVIREALQRGEDIGFGLRIESRCCLIANEDRSILEYGSRDCNTLFLTSREAQAAFSDLGLWIDGAE